MNVLITGGGGFLGQQLAKTLLRKGCLQLDGSAETLISSLTLADQRFGPPADWLRGNACLKRGDLGDPHFASTLITEETSVLFHLAAMVSGEGERDFDGCLRSNLDGTRNLLEAARETNRCPRVLFASSVAVFGGHTMTSVVSDTTKAIPQTTYGMTKLIGELLINEYSRKGFIDGRTARLPTVFIRPGTPNAAASSFASSLFREPLAQKPCRLPVPRDQIVPLLGYRNVVENLIRLAECQSAYLGSDRAVTLPSKSYRISDLIDALQRFADQRGIELGPIIDQPDPNIVAIVNGWPTATDATRVPELQLLNDHSVEEVIEAYLEDFGQD